MEETYAHEMEGQLIHIEGPTTSPNGLPMGYGVKVTLANGIIIPNITKIAIEMVPHKPIQATLTLAHVDKISDNCSYEEVTVENPLLDSLTAIVEAEM